MSARAARPSAAAAAGSSIDASTASASAFGVVRRHQPAVDPGADDLGDAADVGGDDRQRGGHRLDERVGERLGSRRQHEQIVLRQHGAHIASLAEELDAVAEAERARERLERAAARAVADEREAGVGVALEDPRRGGEERVVPLFGAQVGDHHDTPNRAALRHWGKAPDVETVRDQMEPGRRNPLQRELVARGAGVGDDRVRQPIGQALPGQLRARLVAGEDLAAVADAYRHAGQRRARQPEDVAVEIARVDERRADGAAPRRERDELPDGCRVAEAAHRELADRDPRRNLVQETAPLVEAGEVRAEARRIEARRELDHLPFRSADVEARE